MNAQLSEIERFLFDHGKFNFHTDIHSARDGNREVELQMIGKLIAADVEHRFSFVQLADAVYELVHVCNHYIVTDGPAPEHSEAAESSGLRKAESGADSHAARLQSR